MYLILVNHFYNYVKTLFVRTLHLILLQTKKIWYYEKVI
ncbi:hypothetical protein SAMN05216297_11732 [Flavobacterium phragmitis]|uniref:Uncharacterized protein n=1 Tax=Flavobacterium phragmitis TaxID=739143 RepID=A0A1I1WVE8_9FLAO|nr:hypothetical protein SAMN05216297_11732 [Flavobacterium phragmitis]